MIEREKYREGKELLMIQSIISSIKHGGGSVAVWACMAASGTRVFVAIDDVTADKKLQDEF